MNVSELKNPDISGAIFTLRQRILILNSQWRQRYQGSLIDPVYFVYSDKIIYFMGSMIDYLLTFPEKHISSKMIYFSTPLPSLKNINCCFHDNYYGSCPTQNKTKKALTGLVMLCYYKYLFSRYSVGIVVTSIFCLFKSGFSQARIKKFKLGSFGKSLDSFYAF